MKRSLLRMHRYALFVVLLLVGCSPASPGASTGAAGAAAPQASISTAPKVLRVAINEEPTQFALGLASVTGTGVAELAWVFSAGLTVFDANGVLQPRLAQKVPRIEDGDWKVFPDGQMEVTWKLKPNLVWHDGTPLTAADYEFGARVLIDPEIPGLGRDGYTPASIAGAEATDPQTLVVRWKTPYLYGNAAAPFALPALPRHLLWDLYQQGDKQTFANNPYWTTDYVSVGPFKLVQWVPGTSLEGVAFDQYVLGRPKIDRIIMRYLPTANNVVVNLLSGELEVAPPRTISTVELRTVKDAWDPVQGGTAQTRPNGLRSYIPQFRDPSAPWMDVRVREAMSHMIDKESTAAVFTQGFSTPAYAFIPPDDRTWPLLDQRGYPRRNYDLAQANRLMTSAGWERGADGMYRDSRGQTLDFQVSGNRELSPELTAAAGNWKDGGLNPALNPIISGVATTNQERNTYRGVLASNPSEYDAFVQSNIGTAENRWRVGNAGGWWSPAYEQLVQDWRLKLFVEPERLAVQADMLKMLSDEVAYIPVYYSLHAMAWSKGVRGPGTFINPLIAVISWNVHEWEVQS
jgi:peptide/nickel transport system substrate-binding protein